MQDRRPQVVDGGDVLDGVIAKLVGRTPCCSAFHSAASQPHTKPKRVVVSTVAALREWSPSELTRPHNQGVFQQVALLQIFDQRSDRLIDLSAHRAMAAFEVAVLVPRVRRAASPDALGEAAEFDEPNPLLDQSPSKQALPSVRGLLRDVRIQPVHFLRGFGLASDVAKLWHS